MRSRPMAFGARSIPAALVASLAVWGAAPAPVGAAPQEAGVLGGSGPEAPGGGPKTPKRPDTPVDNTIMAPPLPGYALMFILGGAVVALNLWSSKRTQLD